MNCELNYLNLLNLRLNVESRIDILWIENVKIRFDILWIDILWIESRIEILIN